MILAGMGNAPDQLGLTLVPYYTDSVDETVQAIRHLPPDMDAVLRIASPTLDDRNALLSRAAIERGIPMVSSVPLDAEVLLTVGGDLRGAGEQTARLAHLIFNGASPADLPVETAEALFTVNLETAAKIGLTIPEEVLARVHHIFR